MSKGDKDAWNLRDLVLLLLFAPLFGFIAYMQYRQLQPKTPEVRGPIAVQGIFPYSTTGADRRDPYLFQGEDGREYQFNCDQVHGGRGPHFNICLYPARGNPAGELGGRPVEVRYLALQYPAGWLGATEPHLVMLSVRENGRVLYRNNIWVRTKSAAWERRL
ncbi:hypothetical protein [Caulobacter sp. UNC358MFTsu5.1]|uniref:hypothetical protein n=1 Tax=Caulobacter sp. UNC358MFTsu5.1 TaxID=1449049 RepID=UPI0004A707B2|nr:hypothetical protein [Caulobacter sp. UNC358MFTsu5.1]